MFCFRSVSDSCGDATLTKGLHTHGDVAPAGLFPVRENTFVFLRCGEREEEKPTGLPGLSRPDGVAL